MSRSFWRAYIERIEEPVAAGLSGTDLHWLFRERLGSDGCELVCDRLWKELWRELRRRNLQGTPGDRLGHEFAHYLALEDQDEQLRSDLVEACFERVFSGARLVRYVRDCANPEWDPDGLIVLNLRNLVHELQRKGDPGGTALFDSLRNAAPDARGVELDGDGRRLRFGAGGGAPDADLVRKVFAESGALTELTRLLNARFESDAATHLNTSAVRAELVRGLEALAAKGDAGCSVGELVRCLRSALPARGKREELQADVPAVAAEPPDGAGDGIGALGPRAVEALERAPGLQQRTRKNLRLLLDALIRDAEGGSASDGVRGLAWPKQTLSDRKRRLVEVLLDQGVLSPDPALIGETDGGPR